MDRVAHWIKGNEQERIPPRMVAFDTESRVTRDGETEVQEWRIGCAIRWRTDLKSSDHSEAEVFSTPESFWSWVSEYCRKGTRTVVWAHNMGYDVRISRMFEILPCLGFRLEWCNLDRNISSATWRSDHGTIVLADTWTWVPIELSEIAPMVGLVKYKMPRGSLSDDAWTRYCTRDAEIVYHVAAEIVKFIRDDHLGNWQPTGAGMSMSTWRHKFMDHKILVHDEVEVLAHERKAMHTGRAEAWRHGKVERDTWTEVDLRNAYLRIALQCSLPRKLHMRMGSLSVAQFGRLSTRFALLCRVLIDTDTPVVPYKHDDRTVWPVGCFETWLWENEVSLAMEQGATVEVRDSWSYVRDPILSSWAQWVLQGMYGDNPGYSSLIRTHLKHCSRALIGRLALRTPNWEPWGDNPEGITGISYVTFPEEGRTTRMLHVGNETLIETERRESKNSLPQVTGWIMAECRRRLWHGMESAGFDNIAHVDTDSVLVNSAGLAAMREHYGTEFDAMWAIKGTWRALDIWGPRAYYRGRERVMSGIPKKARQVGEGSYAGEQWASLAHDLETRQGGAVTTRPATWTMTRSDPRRQDSPAGRGRTSPLVIGCDC